METPTPTDFIKEITEHFTKAEIFGKEDEYNTFATRGDASDYIHISKDRNHVY